MKTLYYNAAIFTANNARPYAEAMLVEDGRILAVGSEADLRQAAGEGGGRTEAERSAGRIEGGAASAGDAVGAASAGDAAAAVSAGDVVGAAPAGDDAAAASAGDDAGAALQTVDLGGRRVLPGLIDSHMHGLVLSEYSKQISCLPPRINSIAELIEAIRSEAQHTPSDQWILGWGYDEGKLDDRRPPDRFDLDQGAPDHPVFLARTCVHIASVNSKALELAGITRDTPDPEGGHIVRDENGEPTGILQENARNLVLRIMPGRSFEEKTKDVVDLGRLLLSQGIVAFSDMGSFDSTDCYQDYLAAAAAGLRQDVAIYYFWDQVRQNGSYTLTEASLDPEQQIHVAGLKVIGDGSISGHTAWVEEPYLGTEEHGICELDPDLLEDALDTVRRCRCQLAIHAMGGRTIRRVLDRLCREEIRTRNGAPAFRMEHITEPDETSIDLAADKGIWFSMQPVFQYSEIESYLASLGPERTRQTYPVRTLLQRGVNLSLSTDAPATSWAVPSDPWTNLKAAVTRTAYDGTDCGQDQRIDLETALRLYTKEAAEICGFEKLGQLRPGYRASFLVLEEDVLQADPDLIDRTRVARVYIDGELVHALPAVSRA